MANTNTQRLAFKIAALRESRRGNKSSSSYNQSTVLGRILHDRPLLSQEELGRRYVKFAKDHSALFSMLMTSPRQFPLGPLQRILDARMDTSLTEAEVAAITQRELTALAPTSMPVDYDPGVRYPLTEAIRNYMDTGEVSPVIPQYIMVKMQENPFTDTQLELLNKHLFLQEIVKSGKMSQEDADNIFNTENARIHDPRLLEDDVPQGN
jgi:hypothetical protein